MRSLFLLPLTLLCCSITLSAEQEAEIPPPFTAKVCRNKVRLRTEPNLDAHIIKEMDRDELLAVIEENDEFWAARPSKETKAYVYSNYVEDGVIQGERVNIRLRPDLDSPILTQLNSGDPVEGQPCGLNRRWTEITIPEGVRFYVAKELVEPVGDIHYIAEMEEKKERAKRLIDSAWTVCKAELKRPFEEINIDQPLADLREVIQSLDDVPEECERAEELLSQAHRAYTTKRLEFLESKVISAEASQESRFHPELNTKAKVTKKTELSALESSLSEYRKELEKLESTLDQYEDQTIIAEQVQDKAVFALAANPSKWTPLEEKRFSDWAQTHPGAIPDDFYQEEKQSAKQLCGIIASYSRPIKNKPGDYLLLEKDSRVPIAILYSTILDLEPHVGESVTISASPRENNHFAWPAYFALSIE